MRKRASILLSTLMILIFTIPVLGYQQITREKLEGKRRNLLELKQSITEKQKKIQQNQAEIEKLKLEQEILEKRTESEIKAVAQLEQEIPKDEEELNFVTSASQTVVDITGSRILSIDFGDRIRFVLLHGVLVPDSLASRAQKELRRRLLKKKVFIRCADPICNEAYVYESTDGPSINSILVSSKLAEAVSDARHDVAALAQTTPSGSPSTTSSPSTSPTSTAGKDVQVRGYYRKDGTYVKPHTRSAPGTRKKP